MSVAFRRDGDEEHLEPKFEIPIPPGRNLVTARGLAQIAQRVAELETTLSGLIASAAAETEINACRRDLRYWQTWQITAEVAPTPTGDVVEIGTTVTLRMNDKEQVLAIVGYDEAEPAAGLIAFSSPLARALLDTEAGELLEFGGKADAIEVLSIAVTG